MPPLDIAQGFDVTQDVGPNYLGGQLDSEARIAIQIGQRLGAVLVLVVVVLLCVRLHRRGPRNAGGSGGCDPWGAMAFGHDQRLDGAAFAARGFAQRLRRRIAASGRYSKLRRLSGDRVEGCPRRVRCPERALRRVGGQDALPPKAPSPKPKRGAIRVGHSMEEGLR